MNHSLFRLFVYFLATLGLILSLGNAAAQSGGASDYPNRAIRLIVPFSAGGPVDIISRSLTPKMSESLGQQVVVDNRGGAGSTIGTALVAKAVSDGYTLLVVSGSYVINPAMIRKLPYDSVNDFTPISIIAEVPIAMVIHPSMPVRTLKEFIAFAKARPGQIAYGSPGRGTVAHLSAELLSSLAGIKMVHVPYKGAAPAMIEVMSGEVQLLFAALPGVIRESRQGRLRMLAQAGKARSESAPDIPTFVESGMPGFVVVSRFGLLAPAGTARPIVDRVRRGLLHALADPVAQKRLMGFGAEPVGSTPEEQLAFTKSEIARWKKVARDAGIEPR